MTEAVHAGSWAAFAALFAVFAWTDLRTRKIRNAAVLAGAAAALAGYALLAYWTWRADGRFFVWGYFAAAAQTMAGGCAAALLLWALRLWPAGDAKLFMMLSAFLPLIDPDNPQLPWRAVLVALMNAFIPAALGVIAAAFAWLWRTRVARLLEARRALPPPAARGGPRLRREAARGARAAAEAARARLAAAAARPGAALWAAADWAGFFAAAAVLLAALTARWGQSQWAGLALCAFSFLAWGTLGALLGRLRPLAAWGGAAAAFRLVPGLDPWAVGDRALHLALYGGAVGAGVQALFAWLRGGTGGWWLWGLVPVLLAVLGPWLALSLPVVALAALLGAGAAAVAVHVREDVLEWRAEALEPYLVLSAHSLEVIRRDPDFYEEHFAERYADGLTHEQAQALRAWCAANRVPALTMQRTLSFAAWIFAGYGLTAWLDDDVLNALWRALS